MKNEDVYLGGNYGKDGLATVYGLAVYFGHKDPRNISWKCSSTVKDIDGAELEALVYFLEWCSTHDHNEPCNFAVRTSSSALITWILVHLPTYEEYGWTHTEQDESIPYEEILRYVDALLDQIPIHPQSPKLSFSLIPAHAVVDGNGRALKLAKKAVAVDAAVKSRDWEALTYVARVDIVHTITSPGFTSSAKEMEDAMLKTQQARARFDNRQKDLPVKHASIRRSSVKVEEPQVVSISDDSDDEAEEEARSISIESDGDLRGRSTPESLGVSEASNSSPSLDCRHQSLASTTSEERTSKPLQRKKSFNPHIAYIRSSERWKKLIPTAGDSRKRNAQLCETVMPNFGDSRARWPKIPEDLSHRIWDILLHLRYLPVPPQVTGLKRHRVTEDASRPTKKQKTTACSEKPTSHLAPAAVDVEFLDSIICNTRIFTKILCAKKNKSGIGLIVVFKDDESEEKYTPLGHIPHLVAAINQDAKKDIVLLTFPKKLCNEYKKGMPPKFVSRMGSFALNRSSYKHDEELLQLLQKVPLPCNPAVST